MDACSDCGEDCEQFKEGICLDCWERNQSEINESQARMEYWKKLTPKQKDNAIKIACVHAQILSMSI